MLAMSLKLHILKFGALMLYRMELVSENVQKNSKKFWFYDFSEVIKRHVLAKGVVCGTN